MKEKSRLPTAGARRFATIRQANRYRAWARSGPEDPHERRQPDPPHGQTTPTKERTLRSRTTERTNLLRGIVTTNDARSAGGHEFGRAPRRSTKTGLLVLLVFALGTVVAALLGASSPALAQEEGFQAFHESTIPAGRTAEATTPASNPETYPSAAQYQYEAPPGGRLMDTGGVGLIALLIGGVAALTAIGVLAIGTDDRSEEQRGGN